MSDLLRALSAETGLRDYDLRRIMASAPRRYKVYSIPKRSGGFREIAQPAREVKAVQRALIRILLDKLPVHPAATAYKAGASILDNAAPHSKNGPILKLDLKEFFPSIRAKDWDKYCRITDCLTEDDDILLTSHLLFYKKKGTRNLTLAIGAPSSPVLSNILMYEFDRKIVEKLSKDKVTYTRYADDMTFSAPRTGHLTGVMTAVAQEIRAMEFPKLSINDDKTTYITKKYHRSVTGLTLANDGRVTIGRDNKRLVSAAVHRVKMSRANQDDVQILAGMLAYINAVEPEFLDILRRKYGADIILQIQKFVVAGRKPHAHVAPLATNLEAE